MVVILLADGFEEIEALTPLDVLRRADVEVKTVGIGSRVAIGAHGIPVVCDLTPDEVVISEVELAILPGGMPGATNLDASAFVDKIIRELSERGARLAAICAAPLCLGRRGLLEGKEATCYPGFENELSGAVISSCGVVTDGNITTARGMGVALDFALELTRLLTSKEKALEIERSLQINKRIRIVEDSEECENQDSSYLKDKQFLAAVEVALTSGQVSVSLLQRKLAIGYGKAAMFIDTMEEMGIASEFDGRNPRRILITSDEWRERLSKAGIN